MEKRNIWTRVVTVASFVLAAFIIDLKFSSSLWIVSGILVCSLFSLLERQDWKSRGLKALYIASAAAFRTPWVMALSVLAIFDLIV